MSEYQTHRRKRFYAAAYSTLPKDADFQIEFNSFDDSDAMRRFVYNAPLGDRYWCYGEIIDADYRKCWGTYR